MGKYRKKPLVIEAIKWTGYNLKDIEHFINGKYPNINSHIAAEKWQDYVDIIKADGNKIRVKTLESDGETQVANVGDYIIKGIKGEFYPCKPDVFNQTYEAVED